MHPNDIRFYMPVFYFGGILALFLFFKIQSSLDWLAIILTMCGYILWAIGRINLGQEFYVRPAHPTLLITTGIYRYISHPLYMAQTMVICGLLLYINIWYIWLILIPYFMLQYNRIKKEEGILLKKFGKRYIEYRKKTWF